MKDVDLLAEIRTWCDEFAQAHHYDLAAIAAAIQKADATFAEWLVPGEPRRPTHLSSPNQTRHLAHPETAVYEM